jgi:hypothetical protein
MIQEKFDPKLKECAEELKAIINKYDVAATISLISPTHGEFVIHLPTWSGVQLEPPDGVRIKMKAIETKKQQDTAHLIVSTIQINQMFIENFGSIFNELRKHSLISMSPLEPRITPHQE